MIRRVQKSFFLLFLLAFASVLPANALSLDKFYLDYQSDKGKVYFIRPHQMKSERSLKNADSKIKCDYTIMPQADSVRILATIETKSVERPSELIVSSGDFHASGTPGIIYAQPKKKMFQTRVELYIDYETFLKLYSNPIVSPTFTFKFDGGETLIYTYPKKEWNKFFPLFRDVFSIIKIQTSNE